MNNKTGARVHWSFWMIGVVALIWHAMGSMNFVMQMNASAVSKMPESFRAVIESRPVWATSAFALAVFGGAIGSVLLLLRRQTAAFLFIASMLGVIVQMLPFLGIADVQPSNWIGSLMSLVVAAFLIWYSKYTDRKGWLN